MNLHKVWLGGVALVAMSIAAGPAAAQQAVDRADPAVAERELSTQAPLVPDAPAPARVTSRPVSDAVFDGDIPVGAIIVDGGRTFRAVDFAPVIAAYAGRRLSASDLKALAQAVADLARARGYVFASAWIPQQTVASGVLRVRLDEGRIDEIRIKGAADDAPNGAVTRALSGLSDGRPVTRRELERALLLAGDLPGVRVAETRYQREGERGVLVVDTVARRIIANVQIDNRGSGSVGPVRMRVRTDVNGVLLMGDQLTLRGTLTPVQPKELATIGFDYAVDTGIDGLLAGVGGSYTRVQPGGLSRTFAIDGRSASVNANLSYPLVRKLDANLWATADFTVRDVEQDRMGELVRNDRFATVTLGLSGYRSWLGGYVYGRLAARQGLNAFDATRGGDPLSSRRGGSAIFSKLDAYVDWTGPLAGPIKLRVAAEGQVASRGLLSSEEMGIGGPRFGRGYDYSEQSGDRGAAGMIELRYDLKGLPIKRRTTQLYVFADAGTVGNVGGKGRGGSLYSAGGGVRFDVSRIFDAGLEAGFPIGKDRFETRDRSPRIAFTLSARF